MENSNNKSEYNPYHGDCIEVMQLLSYKFFDLILCDLPYNITKKIMDGFLFIK